MHGCGDQGRFIVWLLTPRFPRPLPSTTPQAYDKFKTFWDEELEINRVFQEKKSGKQGSLVRALVSNGFLGDGDVQRCASPRGASFLRLRPYLIPCLPLSAAPCLWLAVHDCRHLQVGLVDLRHPRCFLLRALAHYPRELLPACLSLPQEAARAVHRACPHSSSQTLLRRCLRACPSLPNR